MMAVVPEQHSQLPRTMPELTAHGITTVVGGLTPAMLGVLLLNVVGIAAAVYFLNLLIKGQQTHLDALLNVQERQMAQFYTMEQRHFGVFTEMIKTGQADLKDLKTPPVPPPTPEFPFRPDEPGGSP